MWHFYKPPAPRWCEKGLLNKKSACLTDLLVLPRGLAPCFGRMHLDCVKEGFLNQKITKRVVS